jgi:hypothetical protein
MVQRRRSLALRWLVSWTVGVLALAAAAPPAAGGTEAELDEGLTAGPWILAPFASLQFEAQDNIFRTSPGSARPKESDDISDLAAGLVATLPFRNSHLRLDYRGNRLDYRDHVFERDVSHDGLLELSLNLRTQDRLVLREQVIRSFADLSSIDEGGELVFEGQPFNVNRWEVEMLRQVGGRPGYVARFTRVDVIFQTEQPVPFFDYRGFDTAFEYQHPLAGQRWFVAHVSASSFDHFDPDDPVGVPFREARSESVQAGLRGSIVGEREYFVRVGYGRFRFGIVDADDFGGLVGEARLRMALGPRMVLELSGQRRPLASSFDTFYTNSEFGAKLERQWTRLLKVGLDATFAENAYGEDTLQVDCQGRVRRDTRLGVEGFVDWSLHPRLAIRLGAEQTDRDSNCDQSRYEATSGYLGLRMGWF